MITEYELKKFKNLAKSEISPESSIIINDMLRRMSDSQIRRLPNYIKQRFEIRDDWYGY